MIDGQMLSGRKGHVYFFGGFQYPSVTTILHRVEGEPVQLKRWRENYRDPVFKNAQEYTRYTSIRGTFVHYVVLNSISPFPLDPGNLPSLDEWSLYGERLIREIANAKHLWDDSGVEVHGQTTVEQSMCNHEKWYAGTPDLVADITYEGKRCYTLVDLKTSKSVRESHRIQIGAYAQMIKRGVERGLLVYLDPTSNMPRVVVLDIDDIRENTALFNVRCDDFYKIPGVADEYGLVLPG